MSPVTRARIALVVFVQSDGYKCVDGASMRLQTLVRNDPPKMGSERC